MKFNHALHAEGWGRHIDTTPTDGVAPVSRSGATPLSAATLPPHGGASRWAPHRPHRMLRAGAKPLGLHTPFPWVANPPSRVIGAGPVHREPAAVVPGMPGWALAAGVGVLVVGVSALAVSHQRATRDPASPLSTSATQVAGWTPPPELPVSPDQQLKTAPPAAGVTSGTTPTADAAPTRSPIAAPTAVPTRPSEDSLPTRGVPTQRVTEVPAEPAAVATLQRRLSEAQPLARVQPETVAQAPAPAVSPVQPMTVPPVSASTPPATVAAAPAAASEPAAAAPAPVVAAAPAVTPDPADAGITQQVRQALATDARLAGLGIVVSTDRGVVKLEGQAPDPAARDRAGVLAATTQGVKAVDNRLSLPAVASGPASAATGA
ncbi:BON domain-containing protein [Roseateles sp. BYS87W]|uniref:BON domain-containing protein n=1 Tax=Pelomonas baiyunensis TaxID=3299026 RepID=A0ABW7GU49_9BURK